MLHDGIGGVAFVLHGNVPSSLILHGPTAKSFICQDCFLRTDWGLDRRIWSVNCWLLPSHYPGGKWSMSITKMWVFLRIGGPAEWWVSFRFPFKAAPFSGPRKKDQPILSSFLSPAPSGLGFKLHAVPISGFFCAVQGVREGVFPCRVS